MPKKAIKKTIKKAVVKRTKKAVKRAGRPKGSGKYGCETKAIRIPSHLEDDIQAFIRRKLKAAK